MATSLGGRPIKSGRWSGRATLAVLQSWSVRAGALERLRRQVPGGSGTDLIGNVAGGRPINRRGRGVGAVAPHWRCCRRGVLDEHTAWSELLFASLKAGAWAAGSLNGLALYLTYAPPTTTEKLETCEDNIAATLGLHQHLKITRQHKISRHMRTGSAGPRH